MNNYIVNNIPSSNRKDFGYKSINSSAMHNKNQEEILNDILDLFNKTNNIEKIVNEQLDYIKLENTTLESIYVAMYNKYKDLYQMYESILNTKSEKRYLAMPHDCTIYDDEFGAVINNTTNDITVRPSKKVSKLVVFDSITENVYIPDSLNVSILIENTNGIISATDNDIYAPFYNDNNLYWTRKVVTDNTVEEIETDYIIDMPEDIMITQDVNEIYISPFLCKVKAVYGRFGDSNAWELIDGQDYNDAIAYTFGITGYINVNRPFRLNFPDTKMNQIKIVVVSSSYTEGETNLRTFKYGIKQIAAFTNYYNFYEANTFQFEFSLKDHNSLTVTDVIPHFNNAGVYSKNANDFACDIYYKDTEGYYHKIVDTFPFIPPTKDLLVKCEFGGSVKTSNIKHVEVRYNSSFKLPPDMDPSTVKQVDSKGSHVVALKTDGSVWTWGSNQYGQLTSSENLHSWDKKNIIPTKIKNLNNIKAISTGLDFTVALQRDGTVWAFGDNFYGQLGNETNVGTNNPNLTPVKIKTLSNIVSISAGSWHCVAVNTAGEVFTWGYNYYGQLGYSDNVGTHNYNFMPTKVDNLPPIIKADAGFWHTTAINSTNDVYSWGYNESGQLGYDTENSTNYIPKLISVF